MDIKNKLFFIIIISSTMLCSFSFIYRYIKKEKNNNVVTTSYYNEKQIRTFFSKKRTRLEEKEINTFYNPIYQLCKHIDQKENKQMLYKHIMFINDIYNNISRPLFRRKYQHLPFIQYVYIIDRMIKKIKKYADYNSIYRLTYIRSVIIQQHSYYQEKLVLSNKNTFNPFSLLKFTFGIFKLI